MNLYEKLGEEKIDKLIEVLYDDIIANDDRLNLLFVDGFERIKIEQKKFFRIFLGAPQPGLAPTINLKEKHSTLPISKNEAMFWYEDFEKALDKIELDDVLKDFIKQKIKILANHMINVIK